MIVHTVGYEAPEMFDTIVVFHGVTDDGTTRVRFGVDHRPARDLARAVNDYREALDDGDRWAHWADAPAAEVEDWAILATTSAE